MKKYRFELFKLISEIGVLLVYFFMFYVLLARYIPFEGLPGLPRQKVVIVCSVLYCLLFWIFLTWLEALSIGKRRLLDLIFGFFFSSFCVNLIAAVLCRIFMWLPFWRTAGVFVLMVLVQSAIGFLWVMICHKLYERFQFRKEAVFVYGNREDKGEFVRVNNTINKYFRISRSVDFREGIEAVKAAVGENGSDSVVYLGDIPSEIRNVILKYCMENRIDCYTIPKISDIYIQSADMMQLNDKLLLHDSPLELEPARLAVKRLMDIVVSAVLLAVLSPVMLVIAALIKAEDGGPVLYRQKRVTKDEKEFDVFKFRSMRVDAEADGARMAGKNDERVTRVGRVIRNIHFDELPQLVNVLRGEMSLVGPRPERKEFIEEYSERVPEFRERLKVKGGLTGYAQVYGRYNSEPEDKIKYDLYYIYNYSLFLDIKILILTVRILFQKENTEGIEEGQRNALKQKKSGPPKKEEEKNVKTENAEEKDVKQAEKENAEAV